MMTEILVNIGSGNGSLSDGTEPLPEPKLTNHQLGLVAFTWVHFSQEIIKISILDVNLENYKI